MICESTKNGKHTPTSLTVRNDCERIGCARRTGERSFELVAIMGERVLEEDLRGELITCGANARRASFGGSVRDRGLARAGREAGADRSLSSCSPLLLASPFRSSAAGVHNASCPAMLPTSSRGSNSLASCASAPTPSPQSTQLHVRHSARQR